LTFDEYPSKLALASNNACYLIVERQVLAMATTKTNSLPKGAKKVTAEVANLLVRLKMEREYLNEVKRNSDDTRKQILDLIGEEEAILYFKNEVVGSIDVDERESLDTAKLRIEQPEIYNSYLKSSKRTTLKSK